MKFFILLFAMSAFSIMTNAQPTSDKSIREEIIELEKSFAYAIQSRDTVQTKMFQANNYFLAFTVEGMPIQIVPRQSWLNLLKDYVTESYTIDDIYVNVYGNTAVAMLMYTQTATVHGKDRSGQFVLTDIWVNTDNGWKITERHSSSPGRNVNMQSK